MIIVVGSINMDVCLNVDKIPVPGETVMAEKVSKNCKKRLNLSHL